MLPLGKLATCREQEPRIEAHLQSCLRTDDVMQRRVRSVSAPTAEERLQSNGRTRIEADHGLVHNIEVRVGTAGVRSLRGRGGACDPSVDRTTEDLDLGTRAALDTSHRSLGITENVLGKITWPEGQRNTDLCRDHEFTRAHHEWLGNRSDNSVPDGESVVGAAGTFENDMEEVAILLVRVVTCSELRLDSLDQLARGGDPLCRFRRLR